jgi:hypothetical protein
MRRWVAAVVAVLFLSTATLHVFAHHSADADCGVCHVQQASLPSTAAPSVVAAPVPEVLLAEPPAPRALTARLAAAAARAPPVLPA